MMPTSILPSVKSKTLRVFAVCFMLASLSALTLILCVGCQQTVPSPFSGQDVTAEQLVREADAEARKLEREAEEKAATAEKRIKAAQAQARARIREIRGNVEQTAAESARIVEGVQDELGVQVAEAETDFTQAVNRLESETADLEATTTNALAAIEAKRQRALGVLNFAKNIPIVGQAAASAGVDINGLGALLFGGASVGTIAYQVRRGRKLADASWEDAKKEAAEAKAREDKAWDDAQTEMLRLLTTLPRTS
ncbi:MAG: hypothetical protein EBR82_50685 [Caulobacteraceae bacterium]|nr:hypothetical protein [Caulobacteraceae bacterium]